MTTSRERILELIASGKISASEGEQLLSSMERSKKSIWAWVFDPLKCVSTSVALALCAATVSLQLALSRLGFRFPGALDLKYSGKVPGWTVAGAEVFLALPVAAALFWLVAWAFGRRGRFVDVLAGVGLARVPLLLSGVLIAPFAPPATLDPEVLKRWAILALPMLPLIGWSIAALVLSIRTATGLRGAKFVVAFLLGLIAAEVVAKVALATLF